MPGQTSPARGVAARPVSVGPLPVPLPSASPSRNGLAQGLTRAWFRPRLAAALWALLPLSALFATISGVRRYAYAHGWSKVERPPVPVVVVGNLIVGGAGKTPLTQALARDLRARGRRPGIVSRGYGGSAQAAPRPVRPDSEPAQVGDEPLLLAATGVPVWVGRDRAAAARALLAAHPDTDLLLCDDGLQHLRLGRDLEIAVFDQRGAGNGWRLPAGPLRDPMSRLGHLTGGGAVVVNGGRAGLHGKLDGHLQQVPVFDMVLAPGAFHALADPDAVLAPAALAAQLAGGRVVAFAGIGDPARFFATLTGLGLSFEPRAFPDHHAYTPDDFAGLADATVLMTEKDGVKCRSLPLSGRVQGVWVLPVTARLAPDLTAYVLEKIDGCSAARHPGLPGVQGQPGVPKD